MDPQTTPPPTNPAPAPMPLPTEPAAAMPPGMITPSNQPASPPTKSKKPLIIALVLAIVLVVVGAALALTVFKKDSPVAKKQDTTKVTTSEKKTTTSKASALACLTQDDYKWFFYDKQPSTVTYDDTYDAAKFTSNPTGEMFFKPDSTTEDSFGSVYDDWADFAKHNENKQWKFRLEGSTYGSDSATAASKQLATDRSTKVTTELTKRGVAADRIVVDPPHDYSQEEQDSTIHDIYRRVQVIIDPTCTSSITSQQ